jgi:hypothetical protein
VLAGSLVGLLLGALRCWAWRGWTRRKAVPRAAVLSGTVGRVSIPIPSSGVGAVAYARFARRATLPARAIGGGALARGSPVVIVLVERNVALVQELTQDIQEIFR